MLKVNTLLLTVTISFFSIFLFKTESRVAFKAVHHSHDIKIDSSINACAINTNNSFVEFFTFNELKTQSQTNYLESFKPLNDVLVENNARYLKACDFIDLNLTIREIVFPYHSFL